MNFDELIVWQDDHLLAIDKPWGHSTLQERTSDAPGLLVAARRSYPYLRICHRLDKYTTGVLLFAKTDDAYKGMEARFRQRQVDKRYLALVDGHPALDSYSIDAAIAQGKYGLVKIDSREGRPSQTLARVHTRYSHHSLMECKPITGRTHQVRIHLSYTGTPLTGDTDYGGKALYLSQYKRKYKLGKTADEERPLNHSFLLHAASLAFDHPVLEGERVQIAAPVSGNYAACLKILDRHGNPEVLAWPQK